MRGGFLGLAARWRRVESLAIAALIGALVAAVWAPTAASAAPANDDFAAAQDLGSSLPVTVSGSNFGATLEVGEPSVPEAAGHSVWFSWQAVETGPVTVDTCGSDRDTVIAVYRGTSVGALTRIANGAGNQGLQPFCWGSKVVFEAVAGSTYAISVDGKTAAPEAEGAFSLSVGRSIPPANDSFSQAEPLSLDADVYEWGDNRGATKEVGEPDHRGEPGGASVWYRVTAERTGGITVDTCVLKQEFDVAVYLGSSVSGLAPVPANAPRKPCGYSFDATAGTTYYIAVDGRAGVEPGAVEMGMFLIKAANSPRNDYFAEATDIPFNMYVQFFMFGFANAGATKEPGEPAHAGNAGGASAWFKLTSPISGSVRLGPCDNDFHALVGVYTGDSVTSLHPVASQEVAPGRACNPLAPGVLAFNVDPGTTYRLAIDGYGGAVGSFGVMFDASTERISEPLPTATTEPAVLKVPQTRIAKRTVQAGRGRAVFVLGSDQSHSWFRCGLDKRKARRCQSRVVFDHLRPGRHVFRATAIDAAGADPTPVVVRFQVRR